MSGYLRNFLKDARLLGFTFAGVDGNNHVRLRNGETGDCCSVPFSPSDWRSERNCVALLERLSGRKLPRQKAGRYKHRRQTQLDTTLSSAEQQASQQVDALLAEADGIRRHVEELAAESNRGAVAEARRLLTRYGQLQRQLERCHHLIPPLTAVL